MYATYACLSHTCMHTPHARTRRHKQSSRYQSAARRGAQDATRTFYTPRQAHAVGRHLHVGGGACAARAPAHLLYRHPHVCRHACMHAHACIHTYIHSFMYTYIHSIMYTYIHAFIHTYLMFAGTPLSTLNPLQTLSNLTPYYLLPTPNAPILNPRPKPALNP